MQQYVILSASFKLKENLLSLSRDSADGAEISVESTNEINDLGNAAGGIESNVKKRKKKKKAVSAWAASEAGVNLMLQPVVEEHRERN